MNEGELKRCPFCGTMPKFYRSTFSEQYRVRCENGCGAETRPFTYKEKAAEAWEKRIGEDTAKGVPCQIGDPVWVVAENFDRPGRYFYQVSKVTEVASLGFFLSAFDPPEDDLGDYLLYEEVGKTVFFTKEEADANLEEVNDHGNE